jgi:hypothetical protein
MNPTIDPVQQFFSMFARANSAVWPMHVVWYAAAVAAVWLASRPVRRSSRLIAAFLAAYYVWLGIVFFAVFYRPLDDHALAHAALFVLGGALFLLAGVIRQDLRFQPPRWDLLGVSGGAIMLYALADYPVIGALTGHSFPAAPLFGLAPCPSAIFTAGLLLWTRPRVPLYVLVVPLVWLMAQAPTEALALGVVADVARPVVGVLVAALLVWRDHRAWRERLIAGVILALTVLSLGHDEVLMALGGGFLVATLVWWSRRRPGGPVPATSTPPPGYAQAPGS